MKSIHIATVVVMAVAALSKDGVQAFELLTESQQKGLTDGIDMLIADSDATHEARHAAWMDDMLANGWIYGEADDAENKVSARLVPFEHLPESEQTKEKVLHAIVRAMSTGEMGDLTITAPVQEASQAPVLVPLIGQVAVKYIGKREEHEDNLYGTGLKFAPNEVHNVNKDAAAKMLLHADVYELAKEVPGSQPAAPANNQNPDKQAVPLPNLDGMDKQGLITFAQQHFGQVLPANMKEVNMRSKILSLVQSQGR